MKTLYLKECSVLYHYFTTTVGGAITRREKNLNSLNDARQVIVIATVLEDCFRLIAHDKR